MKGKYIIACDLADNRFSTDYSVFIVYRIVDGIIQIIESHQYLDEKEALLNSKKIQEKYNAEYFS